MRGWETLRPGKTSFCLLGALIAIVVMGCGSDQGSSGEAGSGPSRAEFVKQANAVCGSERAEALQKLAIYIDKHANEGKTESEVFAGALRKVYLPALEKELREFHALAVPEGDEAKIEAIVAAWEEGMDELAKQNSVPNGRFGVERYFKREGELARDYGILECANS